MKFKRWLKSQKTREEAYQNCPKGSWYVRLLEEDKLEYRLEYVAAVLFPIMARPNDSIGKALLVKCCKFVCNEGYPNDLISIIQLYNARIHNRTDLVDAAAIYIMEYPGRKLSDLVEAFIDGSEELNEQVLKLCRSI